MASREALRFAVKDRLSKCTLDRLGLDRKRGAAEV
jgi:hypothetical protein